MKNGVLIDATGNGIWAGGLYYKKNIAYMISQNSTLMAGLKIYIATEKENVPIFLDIDDRIEIIEVNVRNENVRILWLLHLAKKNKCKYIYPYAYNMISRMGIYKIFNIKPIKWIPDFQHNYYPELFTKRECEGRTEEFEACANSNMNLVLSSKCAYDDFEKFYNPINKNVYVVRFVSYIEPIIRKLSPQREKDILETFNLQGIKYICVMNQFWQHKNHIIILDAMKLYYERNPYSKVKFVFTGKMEDYRSPDYINKLKVLYEEKEIKEHSVLLGFIDREEQIAVMKNAEYIIQPSLFEGWGTVLEDAKVLNKTVVLSDIPVHREQMYNKCILFNPYDAKALSELIELENAKEHFSDVEIGILDMQRRAREYSVALQELMEQ